MEPAITNWLREAAAGDAQAGDRAYALVYDELRVLAARQLGRSGAQATLTPTALVNEAFLKLAGSSLAALNDRRHFFNLAARAMRQTNHYRRVPAREDALILAVEFGAPQVGEFASPRRSCRLQCACSQSPPV